MISADDGEFGSCVIIEVENIDEVFTKFKEHGLEVSGNDGVHGQPTDQTWGMREFCVEDPNGNTLRFGQEMV